MLRGKAHFEVLEGFVSELLKSGTRPLHPCFGTLPARASEKIARADHATLEAWSLRLLEAPSLEQLLTDPG